MKGKTLRNMSKLSANEEIVENWKRKKIKLNFF